MRTLIDIDDKLLGQAQKLSNKKTKKAIIHDALEEFIKTRYREELIDRLSEGDFELSLEELAKMREDD